MGVSVHKLDPIHDARWPEFLQRQAHASVFHSPGWLSALERTYGYKAGAFTTEGPGKTLRNAIVYCYVLSWATGHRLVSVPFADHCQPLVEDPESLSALKAALCEELSLVKGKYVELRPLAARTILPEFDEFSIDAEYCFHRLDLRPSLDALFNGFHKSCVQRKIRRAQRELLSYDRGRSELLLAAFYSLFRMARRRHLLPPPPIVWFRNLLHSLGESAVIHVASRAGQPIASIFTLLYKQTLVYKYGGSDARYHNLGAMPFLFWQVMQEGKQLEAQEFDLGRSDKGEPGLATFKDHLGGIRSPLSYYRHPRQLSARSIAKDESSIARRACGWLPDPLLSLAGRMLYKHVG